MSRRMILHYSDLEYKGVYEVEAPHGAIYPEQREGTCLTDYDYTIYVDYKLVSEYIVSELLGYFVFQKWEKEKQEGFMSALRYCEHMDLFEDMDFNDKFYDWCLERFKEEAQEQCHEDYDE